MSKKVVRILSIDGGGIRGIIPAMVLAEIEERTRVRTADNFDLIAGTSTGGILALGLSRPDNEGNPRFSAADLANIYGERGEEIFNHDQREGTNLEVLVASIRELLAGIVNVPGIERLPGIGPLVAPIREFLPHLEGLTDERYSNEGLRGVLVDQFGDATLGNALTRTMVTTYDMQSRRPIFLKSWNPRDVAVQMSDAALATSAAPTFFQPVPLIIGGQARTLIDGGIFVNTPTVSAYVEARRIFPDATDFFVLSLGTGESTQQLDYEDAVNWGKLEWLPELLECMFDGMSDAADYQMRRLLGENYIRLQRNLNPGNERMDDATPGNILALEELAREIIALPVVDRICNRLVEAMPNNLV